MRALCCLAVPVAALSLCDRAGATGFFVNQQDVRATGRVNAGAAAAADDPSAAYFNPAGLPHLFGDGKQGESTRVSGELNVVVPRSTQTDAGSTVTSPGTGGQPLPSGGNGFADPARPTPVPALYIVHRLESGPVLGLAINSPFGQAGKFDATWFGRYDAIEVELQTLNIGVNAGMRVGPHLSIGGGLDVQGARTRLVTAIPDPLSPGGPSPATDGRSVTRGQGWAAGFNVGVIWDFSETSRVGVSYRSGMNHKLSSNVETSGLSGPLAAANGSVQGTAKFRLPDMLGIGLVHQAFPGTTLYAQYDWFGWRRFDKISATLDDGTELEREQRYRNAWAASLGVDQRVSDHVTARAGIRFDRTPTQDGNRDTALPDSDRLWLGTGMSIRMPDMWSIDLAVSHVAFRNAMVDTTRRFFEGTPLLTVAHVRGTAASHVNTISVSASRAF